MKSNLRSFASLLLHLLALLGILFIPFSFCLTSIQSSITEAFFHKPIELANRFFMLHVSNSVITSDSATMYLLLFVLLIIALVLAVLLSIWSSFNKYRTIIVRTIQVMMVYYLSLIMLKYGLDKIFKTQFYLPEPNILYTPFGMLDKDILYWSTISVSRSYNIFLGIVEVIPALLLLHYRTRIIGLIVLSGVLVNVLFINLSFDISVKLFSSFLLFLTILLLLPYSKRTIDFLVGKEPKPLCPISGKQILSNRFAHFSLKITVMLFLLAESFLPYILSRNFNDDKMARNFLHGAYHVTLMQKKAGDLPEIKRVFIHRRSFLIFQYEDNSTTDFRLEIDRKANKFRLRDYDNQVFILNYNFDTDKKELEIWSEEVGWHLITKALPWQELPVLNPQFHWTVDEV